MTVEGLQGLGTEPRAGLEQRRFCRDVPRVRPALFPRQALDQQAHDLVVRALAGQGEAEHVVDDHPGRQQPLTLLGASGLLDHSVDQIRWEHAGEHTDRDVVGQLLVGLRLDPPGPGHGPRNNTRVVLSKRYWG